MRNVLKTLFFLFIVYSLLFIVAPSAQAQALGNEQLTNFSQAAGYGEASLPQVIGRIIKIALSLLGLAAVIIIIAGGFIWMSSGGNPEKITKAKKVITSALIGLLIIVFAYAMVSFIMGKLAGVTGIGSENGEGCTSGLCCATGLRCSVDGRCNISDSSCSLPSDAFRIKKIETAHGGLEQNYHQDVYLCSAVQPIFNSAVDSDVIQDLSNNGGLRIESGGDHMSGFWNVRENVLIFKHNDLFVENTTYQSYFPKAILNTQSKILQQCLAAGGCVETGSYFIWTFNTGDTVDDIPPEINSTYPIFDTEDPDYPDQNISRGSSIEVSFSESIDVTTVADENNHPLSANIWVAELDGEKGSVVQVLPSNNFRINSNGNGFRMYLEDGHLFNSFSWYRIHVEGIEDLCLNIMEEAIEWEFQTNDQASGISSYYPQGENACPDTDISVVFNAQMYDNLVRFEISGKDSFTFEMRPRELEPPYEKAVSGGVFKVSDPGSPIDNHFRVFTFNPYNNLQSNADYKVTVFTDLVIDQQGTLLSGTWNFSTATLETCLCSPWIARLDPEQGLRGDCITVYGRCFKGTGFQTAEPTKLEFILSETPTEAVIGGFGDNYITTVVPGVYLKGNRPKVQATITYQSGELTSNLAEFYVKSDEQANGPCLLSINPASGYSDETNVYLSGLRFGEKTGFSQVIFYNNVPTVYRTWSDAGGIDDALVPLGAEDGSVVVINAQGPSNGLPFDVLQHASGPGQVCRESVNCPNNPSYVCSEPVYHCLYKTSDTCRCCCNSSFNSCLSPLKCMANQGNCTGDARGLCCGCQNDAQCGGSLGCGVLDSNKCCYPRPQAIIRIPTGNNICLNTAVEVKFDQVMDRSSLNKDNIKLINLSNNENIDFNLIINEDNDNFIMYPTDCLLQPNTNYKVEVIGGVDGKGIRSEMGVSIKDNNYWSWQFITGTEDNLCQVDYISVSPNTAIVKSFNETVNYTAKGYDAENNIPVCVTEFFWDSGDVNIAMVNPSQGLQTVASPVGGQGEQTVNITAMVLGTLGTGQFTSILSPPVISGLSPNSGTNNPAIPTYVTIAGSGFGEMQKNSVVKFGDTAAKIGCNNWSDTEIVAIAPEGLTIGSDYLVTVTNPEQGMSNEKTFGVRNEFHPAICQIKPNKGETGTQIDIQGINFADEMAKVGKIDFGNVLQGGAELKKDSDKILSWSNKDIKIKAPEVPEQKPQITVYVPSPIETGNPLKPSNPVSFYKQPIINSITPDNGPKQTWVTVKGQNFGSIPGKVYFQYNKTDYLAEELPDYCPDIWTDQMIIVAAPESLPTVPSDKDFYQTRVYVKTAYDIESNSIDWQVNKNPLPPALCQISPNKDLQSNDLVEVKGDRFNLTLTELARRLIFSQDKSAASLEWTSDTEINKAVLPLGIVSGDVFIEKDLQTNCREICHGLFFAGICVGTLGPDVKCDEIQIRSNPLYIAVKALKVLDLPRVIEDSACEQSFQSPSPRHLSSQGCSNTLILARFNMKMNPDTLVNSGNVFVHPNVIIQKCNSGSEEFHDQSCNVSVNGSISLAEFGNQGFVFTPSSLLDKNYWYKVTLKSGAAGIKDGVNGNQLDGNKNGFEEGSPDDDYFWYFKIKGQGEICLADRVEISEQVPDGGIKGVIIKPGIRNYAALPIGPDCQILNPISFIWAWNSTNQAVATAAGGIPSYTAVATAVDLGETKIQATVTPLIGGPTTGSSDLIVATYPSVVDNFPSDGQTDVCRNTVISATFNQEMDPGSFQNNISISPATPSFGISFSPDKKTVNLETGLLDSDSTYTVMIKGPAGVKSKYGVKMSADYSWTFTPGELCQLSAVEIIPQTMSFTSTGSKKSLTAYAKDDKGYEIQGIPGVYTWTWSWESSDTAVVSVKESVSKNETATAQTRNGRAQIVATASIIDSNPVVSVSGQAQADVFLCEVPWIFKDSFGPGSSPNTQFKLSYCRGDYPQGVYVAENIGWSSSNQRHSRVGIAKDESYTGSDSLLIHQDPNEPYPGICSLAACNGTGTGSWPNSYVYAPYCSWQTGSPNNVIFRMIRIAELANLTREPGWAGPGVIA